MYRRSSDNKPHQWEKFDCPFAGGNQEEVTQIHGESRREGEVGKKLQNKFDFFGDMSTLFGQSRGTGATQKLFFVCV